MLGRNHMVSHLPPKDNGLIPLVLIRQIAWDYERRIFAYLLSLKQFISTDTNAAANWFLLSSTPYSSKKTDLQMKIVGRTLMWMRGTIKNTVFQQHMYIMWNPIASIYCSFVLHTHCTMWLIWPYQFQDYIDGIQRLTSTNVFCRSWFSYNF